MALFTLVIARRSEYTPGSISTCFTAHQDSHAKCNTLSPNATTIKELIVGFQTLALATLIVGFGVVQYTMIVQAIRDLVRRPRVRGGNKMSWALLILCLPILGAFFYSWMGPTSFLRHGTVAPQRLREDPLIQYTNEVRGPRPQNITALHPRPSSSIRGRTAVRRPGLTRSRAHNTGTNVSHMRRTGS